MQLQEELHKGRALRDSLTRAEGERERLARLRQRELDLAVPATPLCLCLCVEGSLMARVVWLQVQERERAQEAQEAKHKTLEANQAALVASLVRVSHHFASQNNQETMTVTDTIVNYLPTGMIDIIYPQA